MDRQMEYSVFQYFLDGSYERLAELVPMDDAVKIAYGCISSIGGRIGTTVRVIITDDGDECCFEWIFEKGITFPPELAAGK
jgi:hypothetical protein